jgi:hypothetical protein
MWILVLNFALFNFFNDHSGVCRAFSTEVLALRTSSPILTASEPDSSVQFDTACVANPVVLPPDDKCSEWQCYYYGNDGAWNGGLKSFLPTGSTGLATSTDGVTWTKIPGKERDGAVLVPSDEGWDSVHIGGNDIVRVDEVLHMYYFGGSDEEISMGPMTVTGLRMRIGRAKSKDNGRTWTKDERFLLDYDEDEGFFASWPRIVTNNAEKWIMTYHTFDGVKWRVFGAESTDKGDTWSRTGLILEGGKSEDAFDNQGIGTRSVISWRDGLLMIYEGVSAEGSVHRLGAAFKARDSNKWIKVNEGLPFLEPGKGPVGDWASGVIGTPYVVNMPDGGLRLYHCGKRIGFEEKMCIGVVESKTGEIMKDSWTVVS